MTNSNFVSKASVGRRQALVISGAFLLSPLAQKLGLSAVTEAEAAEQKTITITDELGREVTLKAPIKAVYPDLWYQTEIVRAIAPATRSWRSTRRPTPRKMPPTRTTSPICEPS